MRRMQNETRRRTVGLIVAIMALVIAGSAGSQGRTTGAEEDVVESINLARSTVTLRGVEYAVGSSSRLLNASDRTIGLAQLKAANGVRDRGDMVRYTTKPASAPGARPEIRELRVLEGVFE